MWGVGLTDSDLDLISLFKRWVKNSDAIDIINPCAEVAEKAKNLFACCVRHFLSVPEWEQSISRRNA
jgi:hypothetical protein